jgi:predicted regulator of Ras-like GTPase activity (Roadblock/LC7/MglB family)
MENIQSLKDLLNKIKDIETATDAVLMTKTGMYILGSMRRSTQLDKFAGMAAILMGSAEAMSVEKKDPIVGTVINLNNQKIVFISLTEDILLAATFTDNRPGYEILGEVTSLIPEM